MTSAPSVSEYKGNEHSLNIDRKPREGTELRDLYDKLRSGETIKVSSKDYQKIKHLEIYYRMIIKRSSIYELVGEFIGNDYVDIEQIKAELNNEI